MGKKVLPELDLTGAVVSVVGADVIATRRRTRGARERSKSQKTIDSLVMKAYEKWVAAGMPERFQDRPGGAIQVPEEQLLSVKRAIYSAGRLYNLSIRFGSEVVEEGYASVVFTAVERFSKGEDE